MVFKLVAAGDRISTTTDNETRSDEFFFSFNRNNNSMICREEKISELRFIYLMENPSNLQMYSINKRKIHDAEKVFRNMFSNGLKYIYMEEKNIIRDLI